MTAIALQSKAVIYPANTVSGYGHIYSLGIAGVPVTAISSVNCINFRSRYVRENFVVPDPRTGHERFVLWLIDYGRRQNTKPVLFMAEDLYAYIASLYQKELCRYFLFPYIPSDKLDTLFHKRAMYQAAVAAGIRVPRSLFTTTDAEEIRSWPCYPAVVKPAVSRFNFKETELRGVGDFLKLFGGKAVFASEPRELRVILNRLSEADLDYCVQEYIPGDNSCLYTVYFVADDKGNIPSFSTHFKVRQQPADFGTTSVSRSKSIPLLRNYAQQFCNTLGYTGPATMEFKLSGHDGAWYLMEINPRLGFAVRRSTVKGVNMVLQQYLLSTGQKLMNVQQRENGRSWIDVPGDIKGLLWRSARNQWQLSLWQIVKPYLFFHESVFNLKDPLPGLARLIFFLLREVRRLIIPPKAVI